MIENLKLYLKLLLLFEILQLTVMKKSPNWSRWSISNDVCGNQLVRVPCFSSKFRLIFRTKIKKQIEGTIENSTSFQNLFFFVQNNCLLVEIKSKYSLQLFFSGGYIDKLIVLSWPRQIVPTDVLS